VATASGFVVGLRRTLESGEVEKLEQGGRQQTAGGKRASVTLAAPRLMAIWSGKTGRVAGMVMDDEGEKVEDEV